MSNSFIPVARNPKDPSPRASGPHVGNSPGVSMVEHEEMAHREDYWRLHGDLFLVIPTSHK